MLLSFFKSNQVTVNFFIPVIVGLLWYSAFFHPIIADNGHEMPFYHAISSWISVWPKFFTGLLVIILISGQAILFNGLLHKFDVQFKKSNIPLVIYCLLISFSNEFLIICPQVFAHFILLLILNKVFQLYKNNNPLPLIFDIWTLLSVATLFYFPTIVLLILLWLSLLILRPFVWREWIVGIFGFLVPYILTGLYYFCTNRLGMFVSAIGSHRFNFSLHVGNHLNLSLIITLCYIGALLVFSFIKLQGNFYKNAVRTRGYQQVLVLMLFIATCCLFFRPGLRLHDFSLLVMPTTFFISYLFLAIKKNFWSELLFTILVVLVLYNHFF